MFDRIARSWDVTKQSWNVLRQDKHLLLFPILSSIACVAVMASFAYPLYMLFGPEFLDDAAGGDDARLTPLAWLVMFVFYFVNFFVITFFNSALIGCAMARFNGEDSSPSVGLRLAMRRLPKIFAWAALAATVGVLLQVLIERLGVLGRFVVRLIGMAWAMATFFVVPVLVVEDTGPIEAVKRSVGVLKKTWGESLVTNVGVGAVSALAVLLAFVPLVAGIALSTSLESAIPLMIGGGLTLLAVVAVSLIMATLKSVIRAALYRYATEGAVPDGFDGAALRQAFKTK